MVPQPSKMGNRKTSGYLCSLGYFSGIPPDGSSSQTLEFEAEMGIGRLEHVHRCLNIISNSGERSLRNQPRERGSSALQMLSPQR